jgi:WD40 repeat protein
MTQPQRQSIDQLDELAATYRSRLRVLDRQIAQYGIAVPPHIVLDHEQAERALTGVLAELNRLRARPTDARPPYLGLSTFQERDADLFFGREALVAELVARVEHSAFLAVLGASGSGKSSVVRAGLIPELKGGALPGSERWRYAILKPGDRPLDALAAALAKLQGADLGSALSLRAQLSRDAGSLLFAARMLLDEQGDARLVVVVDQAEELWTLAPSDADARRAFAAEQQQPFLELLLTATKSERSPVLTVLTLRADFLHRAIDDRDLARAIGDHDVLVSPMQPAELRRAIVGPAAVAGVGVESTLVDELVEQTAGREGALPLLEYTLLELWNACAPSGTLTWQVYRDLGGVEGALAARADAILAARYPAPEQRDRLRQLLVRLVQPGEGAADTRRRALLADLAPAGSSVEAVQALLQPLVDERLLTTGRDPASRAETVELAHESLIRAWPTFGRWIDEARADLRRHVQLEEAAKEWVASGEQAEFLWSGLRLANAEAWIARAQPQLNTRDQQFLAASRALQVAQAAQRRRAARFRLGAVGAIAVLIIALLSFALWSVRRDALTAQAQLENQTALRLADLAQNPEDLPDTPVLLAYEAAARSPNLQSVRALHDVLNRPTHRATRLTGHTDGVSAVAFSPDGQRIVTASADKTVRLWDLSGKELSILTGHTAEVSAVAFSPDGQRIVSASADETARLWDLTGKELAILTGHTDRVFAVAFSPDGQRIVTASQDKTARLWDLTGKELAILTGHTNGVSAVAFSPDGQRIATASWDGTVRVWNLSGKALIILNARVWDLTAKELATLGGPTVPVDTVAFSPDGQRIVTASSGKAARVWDLTGKPLATLAGHTGLISAVAFSPDGQRIVTGSWDKTARVWDLTGKELATLNGHTAEVSAVAFSPDSQRIVTASVDGTARLWDLTGTELAILIGHMSGITAVAFSPDGQRIVTASWDKTARVWDIINRQELAILTGHINGITAVAFSPDGQRIVTASLDSTARLWDLTGKELATLTGHTAEVFAVAFSPDGQRIMTASRDKTARVWDLTGKELATLTGHTAEVSVVAFSPDGQRIVTASWHKADKSAQLWDLTSKELTALTGHTDGITAVAFSPDSRRIVTASWDRTARVWDLTGRELATLTGHTQPVSAVAFSPDGQRIVTASQDKTARVWDLTGRELATLTGHTDGVSAAAFSPDGQRIVTTSWDGTARLWDLTGKELATLTGHTDGVSAAAFSPDGQRIVTASVDKTARVWDLTGRELATLTGHTDAVTAAVFSPDGQRIVTASWDRTARQYLVRVEDLLAVAACRVSRPLTSEEIQRFAVPLPLKLDFEHRRCPPMLGR